MLAAMPPMALVGIWLLQAPHEVFSVYGHALADQRLAGELMWIGGTLPLAFATLAIAWTSMRHEEERQRIREAHADRRLAASGGAR
jgi:cytochrome c oxidase assembly factor CtaG